MSETGSDDERAQVAASRPPVDPDAFSAAWAKAEPRLFKHLVRRRGLNEETAADICQEVALRAVLYRVQFRIATDLFRYGLVVANRLATASVAEEERLPTEPLPPSETGGIEHEVKAVPLDVEGDAVARWALHTALSQASAADLRALRALFEAEDRRPTTPREGRVQAGVAEPVSKRERDRLALQLHRAKKRLRARLDDLLGVVGVPSIGRFLRRVARDEAARGPVLTALAATMAGGILGGFAVSGANLTELQSRTPTNDTRPAPTAGPFERTSHMAERSAARGARRIDGVMPPRRPDVPPRPRSPVEVEIRSGGVRLDAEATTPAGTTKDVTVVSIRCDWWVASTICELSP